MVFSHSLALPDVVTARQKLASGNLLAVNPEIALGVTHILIGHSETRFYFGVTDNLVAKKLEAALRAGLFPIICIGEDIKAKRDDLTSRIWEKDFSDDRGRGNLNFAPFLHRRQICRKK